jgi:DNA-binding beta-propeller fold protein YncE
VTNFGSNTVSEISGSTLFTTISACSEPLASALDTASGDVFVTCFGGQNIIDISHTQKVSATAVGRHPSAITVDPDTQVAYVTNQADNTVSEVSLPPAKPRAWGYVTVRGGVIAFQGNSQGQPNDLAQTGTGTNQITMHGLANKGVNGGTVDVTGIDQNTSGHSTATATCRTGSPTAARSRST